MSLGERDEGVEEVPAVFGSGEQVLFLFVSLPGLVQELRDVGGERRVMLE
jgi:hypothetical protein